jgi:alpha-D-xyloside xylohydrolase
VPWAYDDEASEVLKSFIKLKCRLMPYLFAMAVKAHKTGIPVMRPMSFEFAGDSAVDYLDRQYMFGDSLLVAPVFDESGEVDYYLPSGTWTHLLSGEVREGNRWYKEKYDYFSMPLFVRDNTILPMGAVDTRPDYDYAKDVTLKLFMSKDGEASCVIPDIKGGDALTVKAVRKGDKITVNGKEYSSDTKEIKL